MWPARRSMPRVRFTRILGCNKYTAMASADCLPKGSVTGDLYAGSSGSSRLVSETTIALMSARFPDLSISHLERDVLLRWSNIRILAARVVLRSRIVLWLADGRGVGSVAASAGVAPGTVRLWRRRFSEQGLAGLLRDAPGRGRKPALGPEARTALRERTGMDAALTVRERARVLGVSAATVSRWRRRTAG
jgi:transposase